MGIQNAKMSKSWNCPWPPKTAAAHRPSISISTTAWLRRSVISRHARPLVRARVGRVPSSGSSRYGCQAKGASVKNRWLTATTARAAATSPPTARPIPSILPATYPGLVKELASTASELSSWRSRLTNSVASRAVTSPR